MPIRRAAAQLVFAAFLFLGAVPAMGMGAYEVVQAYPDVPEKGPAAATGLIIWNHGVDGIQMQYQYPPPALVEAMVKQGWDAVKLNRNPTYENEWSNAGQRHVARLIEEARAARQRGYARIIFAGQSYGGAIAMAAADQEPVYGVIAMAPGIGAEIPQFSGAMVGTDADRLARKTYEQAENMKAERALFVLASDDELVPNVDRGPRVREIMAKKNVPFLVVDRDVHGHMAGYTGEFLPFANCALWMFDPAVTPKPGEVHCYGDEFAATLARTHEVLPHDAQSWWGYFDSSGQVIYLSDHQGPPETVDFSWTKTIVGTGSERNDPGIKAIRKDDGLAFALPSGDQITTHIEGNAMKLTMLRPASGNVAEHSFTAKPVPVPDGG